MLKFILLFSTLCIFFTQTNPNVLSVARKYCNMKACRGRSSTACLYTKKPGIKCNGVLLKLSKRRILKWHNSNRNLIALGKIRNFKPARNMATMQWSAELEQMAKYQVMRCIFDHDECRNTNTFTQSGQNLFQKKYSNKADTIYAITKAGVKAWFAEYKYSNMKQMAGYYTTGKATAHFTILVKHDNDRVGCAASKFKENGKTVVIFACNYSTNNIVKRPIYDKGKAASGCKTGRSNTFPGLCSTRENFLQTISSGSSVASKYCNMKACRGRSSTACLYTKKPGIKCNGVLLKLSKRKILKWHNSSRNLIALGKIRNFKPARNMATMQWSAELEQMAKYQVMRCVFQHDKCRNTNTFTQSGQNLFQKKYSNKADTIYAITKAGVKAWFAEYKYSNMKQMAGYYTTGKATAHFTILVKHDNDRVGCAASKFKENGKTVVIFACNYSTNNIVKRPIYDKGKAASGCKTGRSNTFPGLCSTRENFLQTISSGSSVASKYCNMKACRGRSSTACLYTKKPGIKCNGVLLKLSKRKILKWHNSSRNLIALGKIRNFKPARNMATMQWSAELEQMAKYQVMRCVFQHDKCRNTNTFTQSGQNLFQKKYSNKADTIYSITRAGVRAWLAEYKYSNMKQMAGYYTTGKATAHFTILVKYDNDRVGCAASKFKENGKTVIIFACNYSTKNIQKRPIYDAGKATSGCKTSRSNTFPGLCSMRENFPH